MKELVSNLFRKVRARAKSDGKDFCPKCRTKGKLDEVAAKLDGKNSFLTAWYVCSKSKSKCDGEWELDIALTEERKAKGSNARTED